MNDHAIDRSAEGLIRMLLDHVEQLERTFDQLTRLDAFNVPLAMAQHERHWRRRALELRARVSVLV